MGSKHLLSRLLLNKLVYACYCNILCVYLLNEGLLFSPAGLISQSKVLNYTRNQISFLQVNHFYAVDLGFSSKRYSVYIINFYAVDLGFSLKKTFGLYKLV
ncbi:hypothetical protein RYX36_036146 [Vicia faba]